MIALKLNKASRLLSEQLDGSFVTFMDYDTTSLTIIFSRYLGEYIGTPVNFPFPILPKQKAKAEVQPTNRSMPTTLEDNTTPSPSLTQ